MLCYLVVCKGNFKFKSKGSVVVAADSFVLVYLIFSKHTKAL